MEQIKCPNCGEVFTIDESGYAAIVSQIRDREFDKLVEKNKKELENSQQSLIDNAVLKSKSESEKKISELESKITKIESEHKLIIAEKESEICVMISGNFFPDAPSAAIAEPWNRKVSYSGIRSAILRRTAGVSGQALVYA